jgi:hypothetical protein
VRVRCEGSLDGLTVLCLNTMQDPPA